MTLKELNTLLKSTGYPVAYRAFKTTQTAPFICYQTPYRRNFSADGVAYSGADHVQIELYTEDKDQIAEGKVEQALSSFFWQKTEVYIESISLYQIIYEIEV